MKKWLLAFVLLMGIILLPEKSFANSTTIYIKNDIVARYHLDNNQEVKYITLKKGQRFMAELRDNRWYLKVGNAEVWISKRFATEATQKLRGTTAKPKYELLTKSSVTVFSTLKQGQPLAVFSKDMRITATAKHGRYYEVIVGNRRGFVAAKSVKTDSGVPILIYHHLVENQRKSPFKNISSVFDLAAFEQQLDYLQKNKFYTISFNDLNDWMKRKQSLPAKAVIFNFDDANLSVYHFAYPMLQKRNFFATTFVIGSRVKETSPIFDMNKIQFAGLNELIQMKDTFDFEHHTYNLHSYIKPKRKSILQLTNQTDLNKDFAANNAVLKQIDPTIQAKYFSYPFGLFSKSHERVLKANNIELAFLNKGGKAKINSPRYYVPRVALPLNTPLSEFKKIVNP